MIKKIICLSTAVILLLSSTVVKAEKAPMLFDDANDTKILRQYQYSAMQQTAEQSQREHLDAQNQEYSKFVELTAKLDSKTFLKYLTDLGYYKKVNKKDEKLNIRNTLLLFQADHNMSVTGTWDAATKDMLITRLMSSSFTYNDSVSQSPTSGNWIVVNKTTRVLTLYKDKTALKKYAVAVGNPSSLTKSGKFKIINKLIDPDWGGGGFAKPVKGGIPQNPLGSRWIGINRTDGSYGIHGTNSFYSIGTYASHGCIRMQNYCVEELFPLVPSNSYVWVGNKDELQKWGIIQNEFWG